MCYSPVTTGQLITTSLLMTGLGPVIDITNVTPTPLHNNTFRTNETVPNQAAFAIKYSYFEDF